MELHFFKFEELKRSDLQNVVSEAFYLDQNRYEEESHLFYWVSIDLGI